MAKYGALGQALAQLGASRVEMTFAEVARVVGELPDSAVIHRPWWANDRSHVQATAWIEAGYKVDTIDRQTRRVVFTKV
jgi:hypothetical protein